MGVHRHWLYRIVTTSSEQQKKKEVRLGNENATNCKCEKGLEGAFLDQTACPINSSSIGQPDVQTSVLASQMAQLEFFSGTASPKCGN